MLATESCRGLTEMKSNWRDPQELRAQLTRPVGQAGISWWRPLRLGVGATQWRPDRGSQIAAPDQQPVRPESVTHVFGMNCYLWAENGPFEIGGAARI